MKYIRRRRIVDNEDLVQFSAQPAEVFDVIASMEDTALAEQARLEHVPLIKQVGHRIGILEIIKHW